MFGAMDLFRSRMNGLLADFERFQGDGYGWTAAPDGFPRTNLYDSGDHLEIRAEVPGMAKDDLNIKIQGNYLEISGTRKSDAPENYKVHRIERRPASFTRSLTLPSEVNTDQVDATLKNGILHLVLPKSEAAKPKTIIIR
jgi:HSP20 family protein